jgi:hypothetical protein
MYWVNAQAPCTSKYWVFVPSNDWTDTTSYRPQVSAIGKFFLASPLPVHSFQTDAAPTRTDRAKFFPNSSSVGAIAPPNKAVQFLVKSCPDRSENLADKNRRRAEDDVARPESRAVWSHSSARRQQKRPFSHRRKHYSSERYGWRFRGKKLEYGDCAAANSNANVPVAQLDRVSASEAEGYRFDSCRGYSIRFAPNARPRLSIPQSRLSLFGLLSAGTYLPGVCRTPRCARLSFEVRNSNSLAQNIVRAGAAPVLCCRLSPDRALVLSFLRGQST